MDQLINQIRGYSFGGMTYEKGGLFGPIMRPYLSVIVIESGSCTMRSDAGSVTVRSGQAGVLAGRKRFEFDYLRGESTTVSWCEGFLPDIDPPVFEAQFTHFEPIPISERLRRLQRVGVSTGHASSADLNSLRNAIGLSVLRAFLLEARQDESEKKMPVRVLMAKRFMDDNISDETVVVNAVARHVEMSPQHLIASFKTTMGITPGKYLWQIRAARARQLLVHTRLSHAQIAFECGFKSVSHFSRSLKARIGNTPSQIRREMGFVQSSEMDTSVEEFFFD
ncbi:AraC family transcriptional regulator [Ruegeria hyattellae]|uniref:AraC family transcriptional regulator n=1 Tax=Ruegeria hyattellae TaxID=3233337 RepID=UPI00355B6E72